jgi:FixJ family two-component response regulator
MRVPGEGRVFVIDDGTSVLRAMKRLLRSNRYTVEVFTSPEAFLERPPYDDVACLLLDLRMPGLSGLDVQEAIAR